MFSERSWFPFSNLTCLFGVIALIFCCVVPQLPTQDCCNGVADLCIALLFLRPWLPIISLSWSF